MSASSSAPLFSMSRSVSIETERAVSMIGVSDFSAE